MGDFEDEDSAKQMFSEKPETSEKEASREIILGEPSITQSDQNSRSDKRSKS
jgi:hypothetical protein